MSATVLRPYNPSFDAAYLPILIRTHTLSFIQISNVQFFKNPVVLGVLTSLIAALLYQLFHVFETHLLMPIEAELVASGGRNWQDYVALGIYAVPPLAAVVGFFYGVTTWYHRTFWTKVAGREVQEEDVALDVNEYYADKQKGSGFWVLDFENELVACFGIDGRNPGRQLDLVESEEIQPSSGGSKLRIQGSGTEVNGVDSDEEEEENAADLALLSQASTANDTTSPSGIKVPEPVKKRELSRYPSSGTSPALAPFIDSPATVQLRHFAISDNFASSPGVHAHVLELALRTAFSPSTASSVIDKLVLVVVPDVQRELRQAALEKGFQVSGRRMKTLRKENLPVNFEERDNVFSGVVQRVLRPVWPLGLEQEVLVMDRAAFEGQGK